MHKDNQYGSMWLEEWRETCAVLEETCGYSQDPQMLLLVAFLAALALEHKGFAFGLITPGFITNIPCCFVYGSKGLSGRLEENREPLTLLSRNLQSMEKS